MLSLLGHQKVLNEIRGLTAKDKLFCNSPFFWIGGIAFAVLATLLAGSTLVCSNATDAAETLDLLEAEKPTMTNGFVAGIAQLVSPPQLAEPRPVVHAARKPVPDHGARGAAGRSRVAAHHARHD